MAHWIGHSKHKTLDYKDFFERNRIIYELEANLTGAPIYAKNYEVSVASIEANADEDTNTITKIS